VVGDKVVLCLVGGGGGGGGGGSGAIGVWLEFMCRG